MEKELKFTCPKCGGTELDSIELMIESYRVTEIPKDGDIQTSDKCDLLDSGRKYVQCHNHSCGFILRNKRGTKLSCDRFIKKWIKENCPQ